MYEDENMIYDINSLSLSIPFHPTKLEVDFCRKW